MVRTYRFDLITTSGADGSATGTATSTYPITGEIKSVHVDYTNQPGTTDVTIATMHAPVITLLTLTDNAADGLWHPRAILHDAAGAAVTYDGTNELYGCFVIDDYVKVTVAQADGSGGDETVQVTLFYEA